nr:cytochrome P450 [Paracoccaceae bacterium]
MKHLSQSPTDPAFVQNPYAIFRDRRFGREAVHAPDIAPHLAPFYAVEAHSMLEREPPTHTRLR